MGAAAAGGRSRKARSGRVIMQICHKLKMSEQSATRTTQDEHGSKDIGRRARSKEQGMRTAAATSQHYVPLLLLLLRPGWQDGQEARALRLMDSCKEDAGPGTVVEGRNDQGDATINVIIRWH